MQQDLVQLPVKELIAIHNTLCGEGAALKQWKTDKKKLIERIEKLQPAKKAKPAVTGVNADYQAAITACAISDRDSIQVASEKLLLCVAYTHDGRDWGLPYDVILAEVQRVFPDAKTTVACLRWYASHLNDGGAKLPYRKRSKGGA